MDIKEAQRLADGLVPGNKVNAGIKSASLEIQIHRADGKDEKPYLASYYHQNPFKHYPINFMIWLRGKYRLWQQYSPTEVKK